MVRVAPPPPNRPPKPILHTLAVGTALVRLFDPTSFGATALSFRSFGPLRRFDHQRGRLPEHAPDVDAERAIYYAAPLRTRDGATGLSSCIVEVFGDIGVVACQEWHVAMPVLRRDLRLLDLRRRGAMRAGTVAALAKVPDYTVTQAWSRYFHEQQDAYGTPDGLLYLNAHNDEEAVALYERAQDALVCGAERVMRLDSPVLRPLLRRTAARHHLILDL